ncbi:MAG: Ig-like domain-containing protein [Oligoflexia bacterium]|nr:Ig-like domain-containing protein [Oligoflexia bacterium]
MKIILQLLVFTLISLRLTTSALADYPTNSSLTLSPFFGGFHFHKDQHLQNNVRPFYGLRVGGNFSDSLGIEAMFGNIRTTANDLDHQKINVFRYGVEAILRFVPSNKLIPFVALGGGAVTFDNPEGITNHSRGLFDYGLGVLAGINDRAYIRADVRHIILANSDHTSNFEGTIGLSFVFGGDVKAKEEAKEERPAAISVPIVVSTVPANATEGVGTNIKVSANFNSPIDPASVTPETFTLKHGTTLVRGTVIATDNMITFTPVQELEHNTTYVATITIGVKGLTGISLANNYEWSFATSPIVEKKHETALVILDDTNFRLDKSTRTRSALSKKGMNEIKSNIQIIKDNPQIKISIIGHTNSKGSIKLKKKLSIKRANAVRNYLVEESGISQDKLVTVGYGEELPTEYSAYSPSMNNISKSKTKSIKGKKVLFQIIEK